jgi:hypothetical protein
MRPPCISGRIRDLLEHPYVLGRLAIDEEQIGEDSGAQHAALIAKPDAFFRHTAAGRDHLMYSGSSPGLSRSITSTLR